MDEEERKEIFAAINAAIKTFEKSLKSWNTLPAIKIEVREIRWGDFSLGESIVVDQILEQKEVFMNKKEEDLD